MTVRFLVIMKGASLEPKRSLSGISGSVNGSNRTSSKQLRDNASDLQDFYKDLKVWGDDMKRKEVSLKDPVTNDDNKALSSTKKAKTSSNGKKIKKIDQPKGKITTTDYSAWDKFDADAECEKVDYDENEESDLTDECDETLRDQAFLEKEKGNKCVKNKQWNEAIACYTKAIGYYGFDPIFYANRALCYLKINQMLKAETDCTMSLKLDNSYVKAYQRRAAARECLNKLEEAELDLLKVLELEPKNVETRANLEKIRKKTLSQTNEDTAQRPVSKFSASRNKKLVQPIIETQTNNLLNSSNQKNSSQLIIENKQPTSNWPSGDDDIIPIKALNKPVHMRSKKPLKRIEIKEYDGLKEVQSVEVIKSKVIEKIQPIVASKTDDLKIIERKCEVNGQVSSKDGKHCTNINKSNEKIVAPKTSVQFYSYWRTLQQLDAKYSYLKLINPKNLGDIFKESLEATIFSQILEVLAECFIKHKDEVYNILVFLTRIKRFSTLTMFLTDDDKNYLWKLFDYCKEHEGKMKEQVDFLIKTYEL